MATKQAVAKTKEQPVSSVMPESMREYGGQGTESISSEAIEIPRMKLLHALSPEIEEDENLRAGEFYHVVMQESLGKELIFTPCFCSESVILWRPSEDGGGILARSDDGVTWDPPTGEFEVELDGHKVTWVLKPTVRASRLTEFGSSIPGDSQSHPAATKMLNVACYMHDHPDYSPVVFTFARSGYKIGKKLMSNLKMSPAPSFGRVFKLSSTSVSNSAGQKYLEPRFTPEGFVVDPDIFERCKYVYESFKEMHMRFADPEDEANPEAAPAESGEY